MLGKVNSCRLFVGKSLGRLWHRWVDNVKMVLGEIGWGDVDWIGLAQDKKQWRVLVNAVMNLWVPKMLRSF
jgi:hypothetical protein